MFYKSDLINSPHCDVVVEIFPTFFRFSTMNCLRHFACCVALVGASFIGWSVARAQVSGNPTGTYGIVSSFKDLQQTKNTPKRKLSLSIHRTSMYTEIAIQSLRDQFPFKPFDLVELSDLVHLYESQKPKSMWTVCFPIFPEPPAFGSKELPVFLKLWRFPVED